MSIFKGMVLFLLLTVCISMQAYAEQVRTIFGKVTRVDVEGGVINVNTDHGEIVFYLLAESNLYKFTHHMSSVEITKGDPVKVKYISISGQNKVVSLVDNQPASY